MFRPTYTIHEPIPVAKGTAAGVDAVHLRDLLDDDLPGGFLDRALKSITLTTPITCDPRVSDPRFIELKKSLTISVENASAIDVTLKWDDAKEGAAIVRSVRRLYIEEKSLPSGSVDYVPASFVKVEIVYYKRREAHEHRSEQRKQLHMLRMELEAELKRGQALQSKAPP